eukprot:TRINITY_DN498_c0_g5_i1.p1 TRINITY_DN498_c0_g5~~TRINITY_DN498_c0_g5_i1.p1  ORF type:complete len:265 (+),score=128.45 TRINITY_DN498_c0_g5_i1:289-1083(+)
METQGKKESQETVESLSSAEIKKLQYIMSQLKTFFATNKKEKEMEAKKAQQEMEMYKSELKDTMKSRTRTIKKKLTELNERDVKVSFRLAFIQNKQLVSELEYQSKQVERLVTRNAKLEDQMAEMKREIEIHKQVEAELARQTQAYQRQIRNASNRLKTCQNTSEKLKPSEERKDKAKGGSDELINFLEEKLDEAEKKYSVFQAEYSELHDNYKRLQKVVEKMRDKYSRAASLLVEFLNNIINDTPGLLEDERNLYLDIERLYI